MSTMDHKAFEAKYAKDQEIQFLALARRNRKLGYWAAGVLGLGGQEMIKLANSLVDLGMGASGDRGVIHHLLAEFHAKGLTMTEHRLEVEMHHILEATKSELLREDVRK